jgi:hypothetical protein
MSNIKLWVCEICGQDFDKEVDLLAHQFNSQCEKDILKRQENECVSAGAPWRTRQ